ncbi:hypothetical protein SAMN06295974_0487 [Plantibacter flavus]|uniref:Tachylectin n=1 Tax=Plantibacter flavus TaxID=150123 RepID=A0A3N2C177_9MICO|nr:hypothetical protein [Plantibacter flavus]ROR81257.1 hypothetical protein EDD42_1313 [Plantibacter flavus]SMG10137.1 hypothetical protein SAMN06295974_0487 [Plantibacter flavus]
MKKLKLGRVVALAALVGLLAAGNPVGQISSASAATVSSDRQVLAQALMDGQAAGTFDSISSGVVDNIIAPVAAGQNPTIGCRVDTRILQVMVLTLQDYGSLTISDLNRSCPGVEQDPTCPTDYESPHCADPGLAVDVTSVGGTVLSGGTESIPFLQYLDQFVPVDTTVGQSLCGSGDVALTRITSRFDDFCNHIHVALPSTGDVLGSPTGGSGDYGAGTLFQVAGTAQGWSSGDTNLTLAPDALTSINMGGEWPRSYISQEGRLFEVTGDAAGWHVRDTGVPLNTTSMSVVDTGEEWPKIYATEGGILYEITATAATGWVKNSTEIGANGTVSAIYRTGVWGEVMLSEGGTLFHITADASGWHKASTGIPVGADISAAYLGGTWPQVMSADGGYIWQIYGDTSGWHKANTGILGAGQVSAVKVSGTWPQVVLNEGGQLFQVSATTAGWSKKPLDVAVGSVFSAVYMGGEWPQIMKVG